MTVPPLTQALETQPPPRVMRGLELAMMITGAGLTCFLLFHLALFRFGMDQAIFAVVGDGLLHGELPYRDRWEMRTPGIYPLYAFAQLLFGKTMMAIRLLEVAALLSLFAAFPYYSRRHLGTTVPGFVGALLATMVHVRLEYWHTGQSENFGGVMLVWALLLATWKPQERRQQFAAWVGAGALFTFCALLKPPLGGGFVLTLALLIWQRYQAQGNRLILGGRDGVLEPILAFSLGGGIIITALLLPYMVSGAISDLLWTYRDVVPGYVATKSASHDLLAALYRAVRILLFQFSPYLFPGLMLWALLPPLSKREREGALYLLAAIAPQLVGIAMQARFYPYHSGGMVHLMALWSAWGFFKLWQRVRYRPAWALVLLVAIFAVHNAAPSRERNLVTRPDFWHRCGARWEALIDHDQRVKIRDRLHSAGPIRAPQIRQVSEWLKSNTAPDAPILVWGPQAAIYFESDRRPASRFVTNFVLLFPWSAKQAQQILRQELAAEPPAAIVVSRGDRRPDLNGHRLNSAQSLEQIPWLKDLLATRYEEAERVGKLTIHRLRARAAE